MSSVIVIGLGAMGSAAALQLASRGHRVVGLDRFQPPHTSGSSHGRTRIIRRAYFEDSRYVPLLARAYELWRSLQADSGVPLLHVIGGLMIGRPTSDLVARSQASAERFEIPHELLTAAELCRRHPALRVDNDWVGLWERDAGYLVPEMCIEQQLRLASLAGADLHFNEPAEQWEALAGGGVQVCTARATYTADRLVITAGPWSSQVLQALGLPLTVTRQVVYLFQPIASLDMFRPDRLPIYIREMAPGGRLLYGFPLTGPQSEGVKVGVHGSDDICTPETVSRLLGDGEEQRIRQLVAEALPLLPGRLLSYSTCLYTMTPDEHFIIDRWPEMPQVVYAAGFSGHGFKFASVLGEVLADLATDISPPYDLELFRAQRFHTKQSS